jgi:ribosomal protein S18 acetylase RimI-like enzyme
MITIRPIALDLLATYKSVRLQALRDTPTAFGSTYAEEAAFSDNDWRARVERKNNGRSITYLAFDDDQPCGLVGVYLDEKDPATAHLVSMWVAPTHRRHRIGEQLVNAAIQWAAAKNARTLLLHCTSNNHTARAFYERLGFTRTGNTEPYRNDPALTEHEMALPLSATS